jgi:uncharacterized protein YraI
MKSLRVLGVLLALLIGAPAIAQAQYAYTSKYVHLRAGPAVDYPVVAVLPPNMPLAVQGCIRGYTWCDVLAGPNRGWVYSGNIVYAYQGANVPILTFGAAIGFGIITFDLGRYWDNHYRGRSWYSHREEWMHRPRPRYKAGTHHAPPRAPAARPGGPRPQAPVVRPGNPSPAPHGHGPSVQRPQQQGSPAAGQHAPRGQSDGNRQGERRGGR